MAFALGGETEGQTDRRMLTGSHGTGWGAAPCTEPQTPREQHPGCPQPPGAAIGASCPVPWLCQAGPSALSTHHGMGASSHSPQRPRSHSLEGKWPLGAGATKPPLALRILGQEPPGSARMDRAMKSPGAVPAPPGAARGQGGCLEEPGAMSWGTPQRGNPPCLLREPSTGRAIVKARISWEARRVCSSITADSFLITR